MNTYTVWYRAFGSENWMLILDIVGDGLAGPTHRFFVDNVGVRYEIPIDDVEFKFSKERSEMIAAQGEATKPVMTSVS